MAYFFSGQSHTFNEYLLVPGYSSSECIPDNVSLRTPLTRFRAGEEPALSLNVPMVSAVMQSVSGDRLAVALAQEGGVSFLYGSQSIEDEAAMVARVKSYKAGFVRSDSNISPDATLSDILALREQTGHSTVAVTEDGTADGRLVGIVTSRDYRVSRMAPETPVREFMTPREKMITAPDGTVWTGALADCNTYTYTQNGDYQIIVTAHHSSADNPGDPVGWYAYRAGYTMAMNPKVTLSTERAPQGSIVAVQLAGILDGEPSLETDLGTVWFRKTASGYMGYIPVTYNAEGGDHTLHLTCGSLEKDITLTVTRTMYDTVTVTAEEDTGGGEEFRNAIWPLYTTGSSAKLWNGRFEAPSAGAVAMEYGVTQMVDGQRSGQATGLTYAAADGETVTAPQAGNVVFAGTLTLPGGTVVIDHGCGVKSYLYGLETVGVERGQSVSAGDPLGTAGTAHNLIYELRIGSKSTDPQTALDGNSGLQFREAE